MCVYIYYVFINEMPRFGRRIQNIIIGQNKEKL